MKSKEKQGRGHITVLADRKKGFVTSFTRKHQMKLFERAKLVSAEQKLCFRRGLLSHSCAMDPTSGSGETYGTLLRKR